MKISYFTHRRCQPLLRVWLASLLASLALLFTFSSPWQPLSSSQPESQSRAAQVQAAYGNLPLSFELNQGQVASAVKFLARGAGRTLRLTAQEAIFELPQGSAANAGAAPVQLRMKWRNAQPARQIQGEAELPGKSHYLLGPDSAQWRRDIPNYAKVRYQAIYPGVDLVFYGSGQQLEYDFNLAPHTDPRVIRLQFEGANSLVLTPNGDLLIATAAGELRQFKPVIYQEVNGQRRTIDGSYKLIGKDEIGFEVGAYEPDKPLIIDPVLSFAAQGIGGTLVAVDAAGNAYLAGSITGGVPLVNPLQEKDQKLSILSDAYIAKLNAAGTALVYSTYLGGNASDIARGLAVDAAGNATIVGETTSTNFTGTEFSPFFKSNDAAVTWSNRNSGLNNTFEVYSLLVDPTNPQTLYGINGNLNFEIRVGKAVKSTDGGNTWTILENGLTAGASVLALDAQRPQTLYVGTFGGVFKTTDGGAHWNQSWSVNMTIRTLVVNPGDTNVLYACLRSSGGSDANAAGVYRSSDGGEHWQLTLHVSNPDSIAVDPAHPMTVYVVDSSALYKSTDGGATWSLLNGQLNFSITSGALLVDPANPLTLYAGGTGLRKSEDGGLTWRRVGPETNVFALALSSATPPVLYLGAGAFSLATTFPGGLFRSTDGGETWLPTSVTNIPRSLAVDPVNPANVYAGVGERSNPDAFVLKLNPTGSQVVYSRLLGGHFAERATSVAVNAAGAAYVTGYTNSADFAVTASAFQAELRGDGTRTIGDAFLVKLNATGAMDYATYFGGSGEERWFSDGGQTNPGPQLALGTAEQVYLTGTTASTDLPLKQPFQPAYGGGASDAFVAKFDLTKSGTDALIYATYLGGPANEAGISIGLGAGEQATVLLSGTTLGLPVTPNRFHARESGFGYLAKLQANGADLVFATYLSYEATSLAVDRADNVYVTGWGAGLALHVSPNTYPATSGSAFVVKLNPDASALYFATPLVGGRAFGIAVDAVGDAYVTGLGDIATTPGAFRYPNFPWYTAKLSAAAHSTRLANVSAASFSGPLLAPDSIAAAFGVSLSDETQAASAALPARLADVEVVVKDSRNVERNASLFFVAPNQINYLVPPDLSGGPATVSVFFNGERRAIPGRVLSRVRLAEGSVEIVPLAPGLFSANADGQGVPAAVVQRVRVDGTQSYEAVARYDAGQGWFLPAPIEFGPEGEQLYLILFGTGFRRLSSQTAVSVKIGGLDAPVLFAGGQPTLSGLDQLNVQLPRALAGRGEVDVVLAVDGKSANPVRLNLK